MHNLLYFIINVDDIIITALLPAGITIVDALLLYIFFHIIISFSCVNFGTIIVHNSHILLSYCKKEKEEKG